MLNGIVLYMNVSQLRMVLGKVECCPPVCSVVTSDECVLNGSWVISCTLLFALLVFLHCFFCLLSSSSVVIWAVLPDAIKWMDRIHIKV